MDLDISELTVEPRIIHVPLRCEPQVTMDAKPMPDDNMRQMADDYLQPILPKNPNPKLLELQKIGVAHAIQALREGRNFLLADGMGMGKTFQAYAVATWMLAAKHVKSVKIVHAAGGPGSWEPLVYHNSKWRNENISPWSIDQLVELAFSTQENELVIIDEIHRMKNPESVAGGILKNYRKGKGSFKALVLGLSGTLVDTDKELEVYRAFMDVPGKIYKRHNKGYAHELCARGQLVMRSLTYPDFSLDVDVSPLPVTYTKLEEKYHSRSDKVNSVFTYLSLLEEMYIQNDLQGYVAELLEKPERVPVILTGLINKEDSGGKLAWERISEKIIAAGGDPVFFQSKPTEELVAQKIQNARASGKKPVLFGSVKSLATGTNLQDHINFPTGPRDLLLTGVNYEVSQLMQGLFRVLRPNSASTPSIKLPLYDHPAHWHVLGCMMEKAQKHPNRDATTGKIIEELSKYVDPAITLKEATGNTIRRYRQVMQADMACFKAFARCADLVPRSKSDKGPLVINTKIIPNWEEDYLKHHHAMQKPHPGFSITQTGKVYSLGYGESAEKDTALREFILKFV